VANVDQRRISNQRSEYVGAAEAMRLLDVKRETLYAYVSRGLLKSLPAPRGRARRYALADLRRLKARRDARRGHAAVAATALDWGAPVLDSAITRIDAAGPHYRGRSALELARRGVTFEAVAEWLWRGAEGSADAAATLDLDAPRDPAPAVPAVLREAARRVSVVLPAEVRPLQALHTLLALAAAGDLDRHLSSGEAELARTRALQRAMAAALAHGRGVRPARPSSRARVAEIAAHALGAHGAHAAEAIDQMLVLSADHELNVSAFVVRVTASAGADLYACLTAGLCAIGGRWHGGMCDRVEAMLAACGDPRRARQMVRERAASGEAILGFGHPLYPDGDPRGVFLMQRARELGAREPAVKTALAVAELMRETGYPGPTTDFALVALCAALKLPRGSATALFALGRTAGWVAHALEQRAARVLLRPRARYVGDLSHA
jgi:citrate synthase